jgi:hypothetical protein
MKRLIICGDSFMSPRLAHPKKHFAEIFAKTINHELISFARSASSNGVIAAQLETAIQHNPDFIIFNLTHANRIEFRSDWDRNQTEEEFNASNKPLLIDQIADTNTHWGNEWSDLYYSKTTNSRIIYGNLTSLLDEKYNTDHFNDAMDKRFLDWHEKINAIKLYYKYLLCETYKKQVEQMIMYTAIHRLEISKIPYIIVDDGLDFLNSEYRPNWISEKHDITNDVRHIRLNYYPMPKQDPGFHLTFEGCEKVAKLLLDHYNNYFISNA